MTDKVITTSLVPTEKTVVRCGFLSQGLLQATPPRSASVTFSFPKPPLPSDNVYSLANDFPHFTETGSLPRGPSTHGTRERPVFWPTSELTRSVEALP